MKIGIFTDSHYSSEEITCGKRYNSRSLQKIEQAYDVFEKSGCQLVICLGDLIDKEDSHAKEIENLKKIADILNRTSVPSICVMGNHDSFAFEQEEFYEILGGFKPNDVTIGDKHLIFIDACYFKNGNHYTIGNTDWKDTYYPYPESLKNKLSDINGEVYIFMHQNIDPTLPENYRLYNADDICNIIEHCGNVKRVYQGHYHNGNTFTRNGIEYVTLPAMCQKEDAYVIVDI